MNTEEILNADCYAALFLSVYGPELIAPEIAFERLGINVLTDNADREKYRWTLYGDKLWREMEALRDMGWSWAEVGEYFGLKGKNTACQIHYRAKKKYTNKKVVKK